MDSIRLAILGVGSVRCSPSVLATLATFYGERPLELSLFDADEERLDLFDRFARLGFAYTQATHLVRSSTDPAEAMEGAEKIIVQLGQNCARKFLGKRSHAGDPIDSALIELMPLVPETGEVLSLLGERELPDWTGYQTLDWPPEPTAETRVAVPHQILRYLNGEEYMNELLNANRSSPIRPWLDMPVLR